MLINVEHIDGNQVDQLNLLSAITPYQKEVIFFPSAYNEIML